MTNTSSYSPSHEMPSISLCKQEIEDLVELLDYSVSTTGSLLDLTLESRERALLGRFKNLLASL